MKDPVFLDGFYWLMMNSHFITMSIAFLTFIAVLIGIIYLFKYWGEFK